MFDGQMELAFENLRQRQPSSNPRRRGRAHWWFSQMRQIVDRAIDRAPAPEPRPEPLPQREPQESQICE